MTGVDPANEQVAQRLASRGRDALVERLRHAYTQAAEVHADVLSIDGDRLETIVQGAADRADGLQWRRALADVASGELGISLTDALAHPAVARAQELVGAPSYEDSLAALSRRPVAQFPRETSRNGGGSQAQPQDKPASGSEPNDHARARAAQGAEPDPEPQAEEEPRWQSMAQAQAPPAERADGPEPTPGDPPEAGDGDQSEAGAADPSEAERDDVLEPAPEEAPEPEPPAAGPSAPPDFEPETIVQAAPELSEAAAPPREPAVDREPFDDPHATQEWTSHDVAGAVEEDRGPTPSPVQSMPPQPTHVVPAPLPPETTAGGNVASREAEPLASEHAGLPSWVQNEQDYEDDPRLNGDLDEQPAGLYAAQDEEQERLRVSAIHLGGVANLPRESIELRLSAHGLDIMRSDEEILGRLVWSEIDSLEVPSSRVRRRRSRDRGRLIVRTTHGDASFEVPGFSSDELDQRIAPLLARFGRR